MNIQKKLFSENKSRYRSGCIVDDYMNEYYHKLRTKKAIHLITDGLSNTFNYLNINEVEILEIAGADGYVSSKLSAMGYSTLLTDCEMIPLEKARQKNPLIKTLVMDASKKFPFEDNTFHVIYAGDIIEHLFDTSLFLTEIYRCLVPNGIFVLTTPNLASLEDRIGFLFGKSPRQVNPTHEFIYLHIRPFTYSKLRDIMESLGFGDFKLTTNLIRIKLGKFRKDLYMLAEHFPSLGRSLIISAKANKE